MDLLLTSNFKEMKINASSGINIGVFKLLGSRLEWNIKHSQKSFSYRQVIVKREFYWSIIPEDLIYKDKITMNIFLLDIIDSYRGWRQWFGYPSRGQRTWTNAWTAYRSNTFLRNFKLECAGRAFKKIPIHFHSLALYAEQINYLWKLQWESEWKKAKKARLKHLDSSEGKRSMKVDLYAMAANRVIPKIKGKSKRKLRPRGIFTLGFPKGFTKLMFEITLRRRLKNRTVQVLTGEDKIKKTKKSKKVVKKKIVKKKKSVWD